MNEKKPLGPVQLTTPVQFSDSIPEKVDVVIIGAGVVGVFSALYMARQGLKVFLCEKGRVAGEQSSRNWGWIRQLGRDRAEIPIAMDSVKLWEEANRQTNGKTGFTRTPVSYLASNDKRLAKKEEWLEDAKDFGIEAKLLSKTDVDKMIDRSGEPAHAHQWVGATCVPNDARAEPWVAVPTIAKLAHEAGALIRENCAVRSLDTKAGEVTGVHTEEGSIACDQVVVCAGAWTSLFVKNHGINIPQVMVRSTVCKTAPMPEFFSGAAVDEDFAMRRRVDGGYTLAGGARSDYYIGKDSIRNMMTLLPVASHHLAEVVLRPYVPKGYPDGWGIKRRWGKDDVTPFENMRVLDPEPNHKQIEKIRENFALRFPSLGKPKIDATWAGMIDAMPDVVPIVDRIPHMEGLIIATGLSGHGFGAGPGFASILTSMVKGEKPAHDMGRFRFTRFSDGSKLDVGPAI